MTKQQAMKELQDSAESRLKRFSDDCKIYPGSPSHGKVCEVFWKNHHKEMEKLKSLPDNVKSDTSVVVR